MGQSRPLFVYFRYFLNTISLIQIEKSVDGVLGIRTQGPQDGRHRQNHRAMVATLLYKTLSPLSSLSLFFPSTLSIIDQVSRT